MTNELSEAQLASFDGHYVNDERWALCEPLIRAQVRAHDASRPFLVVDVGGGNGSFADRILQEFDDVEVVVAEPADVLRVRNAPHERKQCLAVGVEGLRSSQLKPDLICFNWVLHHLVRDSYRSTRAQIRRALQDAVSVLQEGGHVSIYENNYNGVVVTDLPGWVTYQVLRNRVLGRMAEKAGSNTAGVGVCFLSRPGWHRMFRSAGLTVESDKESTAHLPGELARRRAIRAMIGLREVRVGHYWLTPSREA